MDEEQRYRYAKTRVKEIKDFYVHLIVYLAVNTFLVILNLLATPWYMWFIWPLIFWGIGMIVDAVRVFGFSGWFGGDWEQKKIDQLIERSRSKEKR